jgi:demethylmenaquinone methyltransferase / 2-methoxy-6-polyprenyl-1,4-benzoquinol methylase
MLPDKKLISLRNANKQMTEENSRNDVNQMFDHISERYNLVNRLLTFRIDKLWRKKFLNNLVSDNYQVIIDIACGTGDLENYLLKFNHDKIIAIDPSEKMLEQAKKQFDNSNLEFKLAAAESLPFSDNFADLITVAFGIRNFSNLNQSLGEFYRVLKPGGICGILEFSMPKNKIFKLLYLSYLSSVVPFVGSVFGNDIKAYKYLKNSIINFSRSVDVTSKLIESGFDIKKIKPLSGGIVTYYIATKQ